MIPSRVLFVTPYSPGRYFGGVRPPVGMGYLEEHLRTARIATASCDMTAGVSFSNVVKKIREFKPDLLAVSVMSYQYRHTYALIEKIRTKFPALTVIAGGPHVSARENAVLDECKAIDYAVAGEGEQALLRLTRGEFPSAIGGMFSRSLNETICGGRREYIADLDTLAFPTYSSYDLKRYTEIEISTSRGCPHPCIFCSVSSIMGKKIRYRSVLSIIEELRYFRRHHGRRTFQIGDDNFLSEKPRILALCDGILSAGMDDLILRCGQGIRGDLIDREVLQFMKKAGFRHLGIGVESGSDRILAQIRKGESVSTIEAGIKLACAMGFDVSLLFVVGAPGETSADVDASIALARKYPVMKAFFFNLIPFPGTSLYDWALKNNAFAAPYEKMINRKNELKLRADPFLNTPEFPWKERKKALKRTERISKEIQRKTVERKLVAWGLLGKIAAVASSIDTLERFAVRNRFMRRILDRLFFLKPSLFVKE